jgi:hypothetical protein
MIKTNYLLATALAVAFLHTTAQATDVGVSINVSQPGFYGRIDVGRGPAPMVIYPQPILIEQRPVAIVRQPIYLRVPPGHEKHWDKHCSRYNACGQPVYFVQDNWYREVYAPRVYEDRGGHGKVRDKGRDHGKKFKKGHGDD